MKRRDYQIKSDNDISMTRKDCRKTGSLFYNVEKSMIWGLYQFELDPQEEIVGINDFIALYKNEFVL